MKQHGFVNIATKQFDAISQNYYVTIMWRSLRLIRATISTIVLWITVIRFYRKEFIAQNRNFWIVPLIVKSILPTKLMKRFDFITTIVFIQVFTLFCSFYFLDSLRSLVVQPQEKSDCAYWCCGIFIYSVPWFIMFSSTIL